MGKVEYLPFAESVDLMKNRQLNATLQSAGLGVASLKDLSTSTEITVVSVPKEVVDKIGPPFVSVMIPPTPIPVRTRTCRPQQRDQLSGDQFGGVGRSRLPDDQVDLRIVAGTGEFARAGKEIKLATAAMGSPVRCTPARSVITRKMGLIK